MANSMKNGKGVRIKYQTPCLFDLGSGIAYGFCGSGGTPASGKCQNGDSAPGGKCQTGIISGEQCQGGGTATTWCGGGGNRGG